MRTIGEVAEQLDVPQYVLRFWESKFNQIAPEKHRGRRYYRPEDIDTLRQIKTLLYTNKYTIKGVQGFLNNNNNFNRDNQLALFLENEPNVQEKTASPVRRSIRAADTEKLQTVLENLRASRNMLKGILESQ